MTKHSSLEKHLDTVTAISEEFNEHIENIINIKSGAVENIDNEVYKWALETIAAIAMH